MRFKILEDDRENKKPEGLVKSDATDEYAEELVNSFMYVGEPFGKHKGAEKPNLKTI